MARLNPRFTDWRDCHVWLVGASAGIGEALALALAARGARLTLSARNAPALQALAKRCGPATQVLGCDVTDPASLDALFARFDDGRAELPQLGIYLAGDYSALNAADGGEMSQRVRQIMAVNYSGAADWSLRFTQRLLRQRADGGQRVMGIALVGSMAGYQGLPKALGYSPSKAALMRFAECLYLDLAPHGLGVWLVSPGFVATRLTAQNDFRMPALITPAQAASAMLDGLAGGGFEIHFPKRFTLAMKLLALLPYGLSLRLLRRLAP
jgi:NAD(P)-dependent dehydrogenase (short-subunit alcohol dehydrogenase family)